MMKSTLLFSTSHSGSTGASGAPQNQPRCQPRRLMCVGVLAEFMMLCIYASAPHPLFAQTPNSTAISSQRDPQALALLESSLAAMQATPNAPPLSDFVIQGNASLWQRRDSSVPVRYKGFGEAYRSTEFDAPGDAPQIRIWSDTTSTSSSSTGSPEVVPIESAMDQSCYLVIPLISQAIQDQTASAVWVPVSASEPDDHVRITVHRSSWTTAMNALGSVTYDLYLSTGTHLPTHLDNLARTPDDIRPRYPHRIDFGDYRQEGAWIVPHQVEERYLGVPFNTITFNSFSFNTGLTAADFAAQ